MQRKIVERLIETCPTCAGSGTLQTTGGNYTRICWHCHQQGWITREERDLTAEYDAAMAELASLRIECERLCADDATIRGALDTIRLWYEAVEEGR